MPSAISHTPSGHQRTHAIASTMTPISTARSRPRVRGDHRFRRVAPRLSVRIRRVRRLTPGPAIRTRSS
jgi:hypothetical protein